MSPLVPIMLYGWIPFSLIMFRELRGHRAVLFCFIAGALFLPEHTMRFGGLPDYSKSAAICYGVFLAALLLDTRGLISIRFRWFDIPIVVFCLVPIPSAMANDLPIMDGVNITFTLIFTWGLPYFLGRCFLNSFEGMRSAVVGVFIGGLVYMPLCLYEIRMSPYLNNVVYGFQYRPWSAIRMGGFRPNVFLKTGLELGMWMAMASLCGYCILRFRLVRRVFGLKVEYLFIPLVITTIGCKATGATVLLLVAAALMYLWQKTRWRLPILLLAVFPFFYIGVRATGTYDFSHVTSLAKQTVGEERAHSFNFRIESEDVLIKHALKSPVLGWTGLGRNRVLDEEGKDISVTDGYWVIVLGIFGITGLLTFYVALSTVPILCILRFSSRRYGVYDVGAIVALSLFTIILSIDCLLNAFWTVVYPLCLGGLSTVYGTRDSKLIDWSDVELEEDDRLGVGRRLWPAPIETSVIDMNSDARRIPATPDFDTIEDESTLNETR